MPDLPISGLPAGSTATADQVLPIVQGGVTKQITATNLGQGIFNLDLPLTSSGITLSGDIVPTTPRGANLGSPTQPFREIYLQSGSISIESDSPGDPSTVISNVGGNLLLSAGGMQLLGNGSFNAATGSFAYISGSLTQIGNYIRFGNTVLIGNLIATGSQSITGSIVLNGCNVLTTCQTGSFVTNSQTGSFVTNSQTGSFMTTGSLTGNTFTFTKADSSTFNLIFNTSSFITSAQTGSFYTTSSFGFYGAFCSTGSQTNPSPNVSRSMQLETTEHSNGVSIVSGSRITVANRGVYNLQFSAQLEKTDNGADTIYIWFKKNGSNVPRSNTAIDVLKQAGGSGKAVAAWNYVDTMNDGDYLEIVWQSDDVNIQLHQDAAAGNFPSIPSVIATLTQVG